MFCVPSPLASALLLTSFFVSPLRANAQAAPTYGMVFLPRPSAAGTTYKDYDWTGLIARGYYQEYGDPTWLPDGEYDACYGGMGIYDFFATDFGYDANSNGGKIVISGTSTYKWQWKVPNKLDAQGVDTGIPDLNDFPVPKLYVMGGVPASITASPFGAAYDPVTADGKLQNQWLTATSPYLQKFSGPVPPTQSANTNASSNSSYGIISTALNPADTTKTTLQGLLTPTPFVEGQSTNPLGIASDTELELVINEHAFALELCYYKFGSSSLDPFGYADKRGDGKNQYVFSAASNLFIPVGIKLNGAQGDVLPADTSWLIHTNQIALKDDLAFTTRNNSSFAASTDPTIIVPQTSFGGNLLNGLMYHGLPALNSDPVNHKSLGNHTITLEVTDPATHHPQDSEVAHIQLFFNPYDTTHPDTTGEGPTPNWFWYYRQADGTGIVNGTANGSVVYGGTAPGKTGQTDYNKIYIYSGANGNKTIPVFGIVPITINGVTKRLVQQTGQLVLRGLYAYMQTIGHERGHIADHAAGFKISGGPAAGDGDPNINGVPTGDGLLDVWEARNNFNPINADTTDIYGEPNGNGGGIDEGKGDRECCADIYSLGYLIAANNNKVWQLDWAQGGLQWGSRPPTTLPPPYFPWTYRSYDPMTMTPRPDQANLPDNILSSVSQLDGGGR